MSDNGVAHASVLVVDDNEQVALATARLLRSMGYAANHTLGGVEALAFLAAGHPVDLVLLDLSMPGMDGLAVLERIRADPRLSSLRVAMFTASADPALRERATRLGAVGWVAKVGLVADELFALLRRHAG
jgi:CheY-like chemotaxis protein